MVLQWDGGGRWRGEEGQGNRGKEESSSFLKKRTKKLLISGHKCRPRRVGSVAEAREQKFFASFFQKRSACCPGGLVLNTGRYIRFASMC
jgi:hypothetical protein